MSYEQSNVGYGLVPHKQNCRCDECERARLQGENRRLKEQLAEAQRDTERLEFLIREGWYECESSDWRSEIDESMTTSCMGGSE